MELQAIQVRKPLVHGKELKCSCGNLIMSLLNYTTVVMGTIVLLEFTSDSMPHAHASYNTLSVLFAGTYEIW